MSEPAEEGERAQSNQEAEANDPVPAGNLASPPDSETPLIDRTKYSTTQANLEPPKQRIRPGSEPVNPDALARALKGFEDVPRQRERTPGTSPSRKRQRVYGDRYVPREFPRLLCSDARYVTTVNDLRLTSFFSTQIHPESRWSRPAG